MAEFARKEPMEVKLIEMKPEKVPKETEPIILKEIKPESKIVLTEDKSKKTEKEKKST